MSAYIRIFILHFWAGTVRHRVPWSGTQAPRLCRLSVALCFGHLEVWGRSWTCLCFGTSGYPAPKIGSLLTGRTADSSTVSDSENKRGSAICPA